MKPRLFAAAVALLVLAGCSQESDDSADAAPVPSAQAETAQPAAAQAETAQLAAAPTTFDVNTASVDELKKRRDELSAAVKAARPAFTDARTKWKANGDALKAAKAANDQAAVASLRTERKAMRADYNAKRDAFLKLTTERKAVRAALKDKSGAAATQPSAPAPATTAPAN